MQDCTIYSRAETKLWDFALYSGAELKYVLSSETQYAKSHECNRHYASTTIKWRRSRHDWQSIIVDPRLDRCAIYQRSHTARPLVRNSSNTSNVSWLSSCSSWPVGDVVTAGQLGNLSMHRRRLQWPRQRVASNVIRWRRRWTCTAVFDINGRRYAY